MDRLTNRKYKALDRMSVCRFRYEVAGNLVGCGKATIESLVNSGLAEWGHSERHDMPGLAITEKGTLALNHAIKRGWYVSR